MILNHSTEQALQGINYHWKLLFDKRKIRLEFLWTYGLRFNSVIIESKEHTHSYAKTFAIQYHFTFNSSSKTRLLEHYRYLDKISSILIF